MGTDHDAVAAGLVNGFDDELRQVGKDVVALLRVPAQVSRYVRGQLVGGQRFQIIDQATSHRTRASIFVKEFVKKPLGTVPAPHTRTPMRADSLTVRPEQNFINWQQDAFGNYLARLFFLQKTRELFVEVDLVAEMTVINPFDFFLEEAAEYFPFAYEPALAHELVPYLHHESPGALFQAWLTKVPRQRMRTIDYLVAVNRLLWQDMGYTVRMEPGVQSCQETLSRQSGSCRDSAWLLVQILRHLGLAARFVSGYRVQLVPDTKPLDGPLGPLQDFTDLHVWTDVVLPGAGWVGLDPTLGLFAAEGHIPLACSPDPISAAPITGATDVCEVAFERLRAGLNNPAGYCLPVRFDTAT